MKKIFTRDVPCKINLFLEIVGKRSDGYHDIRTVFLPLDSPHDTVTLEEKQNGGIQLSCSNPDIPQDEGNICFKAASIYSRISGIGAAWKIHMEKEIPSSAGLGGGSSDAASTLLMLNEKYAALSSEEMKRAALETGADVPFFLDPVPSVAEGVGEILKPLNCPVKIPIVLAFPYFPVSAAWAYKNFLPPEKKKEGAFEELIDALEKGDIKKIAENLRNDLAAALYRKFPLLEMIRDFMLDSGAEGAEISGSGSSVFAVCASSEKAESLCNRLKKRFADSIRIFP